MALIPEWTWPQEGLGSVSVEEAAEEEAVDTGTVAMGSE